MLSKTAEPDWTGLEILFEDKIKVIYLCNLSVKHFAVRKLLRTF